MRLEGDRSSKVDAITFIYVEATEGDRSSYADAIMFRKQQLPLHVLVD